MLYQLSYGPRFTHGAAPLHRYHGQGRNRTADTAVFSRVLYQLSYLAQAKRPCRGGAGGSPVEGGWPTRSRRRVRGTEARQVSAGSQTGTFIPNVENAARGRRSSLNQIAGAGFEPATFGL